MRVDTKLKHIPTEEHMRAHGYAMHPVVSIHIKYFMWETPIWITYTWNEERQMYETRNGEDGPLIKEKTRQELADELESYIHAPDIESYTVRWGKWGHQLKGIYGWR